MSQRLATLDDLDAIFAIDDDTLALFASAVGRAGNTIVHVEHGLPVGFAALGTVDGAPYLDQLSVRRVVMGRGIGGALLASAIARAGAASSSCRKRTGAPRCARSSRTNARRFRAPTNAS